VTRGDIEAAVRRWAEAQLESAVDIEIQEAVNFQNLPKLVKRNTLVFLEKETLRTRQEAYAFLIFYARAPNAPKTDLSSQMQAELFQIHPGVWQVIGTGEQYTDADKMLLELAEKALARDSAHRLVGV